MQPVEKIRYPKQSNKRQPVKTHHLSTFGILNRNGLEISNGRETPAIEEEDEVKKPEFLDWSMPEQRAGFIKVKKHDFF